MCYAILFWLLFQINNKCLDSNIAAGSNKKKENFHKHCRTRLQQTLLKDKQEERQPTHRFGGKICPAVKLSPPKKKKEMQISMKNC